MNSKVGKRMNIKIGLMLLIGLGTINVSAVTLKDVVSDVLDSSPIVNERLKNYRATQEEIGIAEAGYYPTLDLKSAVGRKATGRISNDVTKETYDVFQNSLVLKQNIFNGFSTHEQVNYQKMRTLAAAYSYLEKANDVTLQTIMVYLEIQKANELVKNSETNVQHNEAIYHKVLKAYKAGVSTMSEVSKIKASLSLARSNNMVQKSRFRNAHYNFRRVVGRLVSLKDLKKVNFGLKIPENQEKAEMYALEYNPSILVGDYNIKGAEALYRESKSAFYPQVDLEVSQNYNDNYNEFTAKDDRFQAMVVVSYNLFNGGADEAARKHKLSKLSQEVSVVNDLRRQVIEGVDLSWSSYVLAQDQIPFLNEYQKQSIETLHFYTKEYKLGERSMLDLISAENDLKRANDELISAKYNLLLSKYRILDAMGLTIASIMGGEEEYYSRVGIFTGNTSVNEDSTYDELVRAMEKDSLPVNREMDGDRIPDSKDVSPNTKDKTKVSPSGRSI